jgi:hypothetical protein
MLELLAARAVFRAQAAVAVVAGVAASALQMMLAAQAVTLTPDAMASSS